MPDHYLNSMNKTFIIAEAGVNHNGSVEIAKKLVSQVLFRNKNLPPTKAVEITNLVGCEAVK